MEWLGEKTVCDLPGQKVRISSQQTFPTMAVCAEDLAVGLLLTHSLLSLVKKTSTLFNVHKA